MANTKILDIMVAQHGLIEALLVSFKDEMKQSEELAKKTYSELVWEVKKHFFVEEQAIFNLFPWKDTEILEMVKELKKEHVIMIEQMEKGASEFLVEGDGGFQALIRDHLEMEEKKLYPLMDERLNDEEKALIISRINEMPLKEIK